MIAERIPRRMVALAGLTLVLWSVAIRCVTMHEPLPGWDIDPVVQVSAITGFGPGFTAWLDVLAVLGTGLLVLARRQGPGMLGLAALVGCVAVLARSWWLDAGDALAVSMSLSWIAAWSVFAAGIAAGRSPAMRRLAAAVLIGMLGALVCKAAVQHAVEGPATIAQFESDPLASLAARGIEPGSPAAVQFERRLRQPDVYGWFGLSNVLASVVAAGAAVLGVALWRARHGIDRRLLATGTIAAAVLVLTVLATRSKAGPAVLLLVPIWFVLRRHAGGLLGWFIGLGLLVTPTAAVVARGLIGQPEGDRSLLFRWFYLLGGGRVIGSDGLLGVGPTGFRQAYVGVKPAEATESVTSAHHAVIDWLSMLGAAGWPWVYSLLGAGVLVSAVRTQAAPSVSRRRACPRPIVLWIGSCAALPVLLSAAVEAEATTIEAALSRLLGVAAWIGLASLVWVLRPGVAALAAGGLVVLLTSQIDLVLFLGSSAPYALLLLGLACGAACSRRGPSRPCTMPIAAMLLGAVAIGMVPHAVRLSALEQRLIAAFEDVQPIAEARSGPVELMPADVVAIDSAVAGTLPRAIGLLDRAAEDFPSDVRLVSAGARTRAHLADALGRTAGPRASAAVLDDAVANSERAAERFQTPRAFALLAATLERRSTLAPNAEPWLRRSAEAWASAAELDPGNPESPARAADLHTALGETDRAAVWAEEALRRHALKGLDPAAGLSEERVGAMRRIARGRAGPS